ncbi:hypothetical protein KKG05_04505 [bacterium]|nr:hypothetical protein [bacterium]
MTDSNSVDASKLLLYCKDREVEFHCVRVLNQSGCHLREFDNMVRARACLFTSDIDIILIASTHRKEATELQEFLNGHYLRIPIFFLEFLDPTNMSMSIEMSAFLIEPANELASELKQLPAEFTNVSIKPRIQNP